MRVARLGFVFLAATWVVLLVAAPQALLGVPLSALTYSFGSLICHQRPERSFHIGLAQLPVCGRCWGVYLGAAIGAVAWLMFASASHRTSFGWSRADLRTILMASALPTAVTWLAETGGVWTSSNMIRFLAALPLGMAVAVTVNYVQECARPPRNESRLPPTPT